MELKRAAAAVVAAALAAALALASVGPVDACARCDSFRI